MKVNIKKASDKLIPEVHNQVSSLNPGGLLGAPDANSRHKKPRDSFAVMRMRNQKHTVGITLPENKSFFSKLFSFMC